MARSLFMPEMTNLQVREYLEGGGRMVIVPVGSTEDHGDHGPLWTDVYIPLEVAKRAAPELDALVGPPIPFGLAADHRGAHGLVHVRHGHVPGARPRRLPLARRRRLHADRAPERSLLQLARARVRRRRASTTSCPRGRGSTRSRTGRGCARGGRAVPVRKRRHPRERRRDLDRARDRPEPLRHGARPRLRPRAARAAHERARAASTRCSSPPRARSGRCSRTAAASGAAPSESTAEKGEEFLGWCTRAVVDFVRDIEDVHDRIEPGYLRTRPRR